ncbi:MAG: hypothetical protein QOG93_2283, partial [Gaiellaceae bacterium]|nr:hypothetical protein [Gaiellaceae bacterium]
TRVPVTIRNARPADSEAVAGLLGELGYPTTAEAVRSRLERLGIVGDRVVVADSGDEVVGLAHLQVTPSIEPSALNGVTMAVRTSPSTASSLLACP